MVSDLPFALLLDHWLESLITAGKSPLTHAAYRRALTHFATWYQRVYGEPPLVRALIPRDIRDWKAAQQRVEQAAPATINQRLVAMTRFCRWAITQQVLTTDPTVAVPAIRRSARHPKALKPTALRHLLRTVHTTGNVRDRALLELLVGTGIRVSECLTLHHGDVVIRERSGTLTVRHGKGGSFRVIPLTSDVRHALHAYLTTLPLAMDAHQSFWESPFGSLSHRSTVLRILHAYCARANLPPIGPHTLRHTFATRYLQANPGDIRGLAALLGHANLATTMIYTEPDLDDLADRMERLDHLPAFDRDDRSRA